MIVALVGVSIPSFWLGLLLLYWFGYIVPIFPLGGAGGLAICILPALAAGLGGAAWYARMMRSSMLDILSPTMCARHAPRGCARALVVLRHVMPNALNPIITMAGLDIPWFIGGVVLVERVFNWPGSGGLWSKRSRRWTCP